MLELGFKPYIKVNKDGEFFYNLGNWMSAYIWWDKSLCTEEIGN